MKSYLLSHFITAITLLLLSFQSQADQWYHVELIIFEQLDTITDEQWPQMPDKPSSASLSPAMATKLIQSAKNKTLLNMASRLKRTPSYQVHYHRSWQQPIIKKRKSKSVAIRSYNKLIEGDIRLYKGNYLHAALNVWLKEDATQAEPDRWSDYSPDGEEIVEEVRNPHLVQSRRIRPKKLYFFDHPKMGATLKKIRTNEREAHSNQPLYK
ncbi:hypothetical protein BHECKSOX_994 [Bathymodiolus heckerae thiotrophic gill symbiont]|uniref:CsiV family protein n=1 Tax=Bathymodiolus heckerae thiotrophic gill symbiont TaxID=1052212 RepID=UPI0010B96B2A|nr:CsiV family protein [Bathymodiolus heckerae thiotrophic gill symbiont]CAC9587334.1 hypothetical protein [uncultured Gammaproteobacteria bacterium]SHN90840.1 hypothetical protein BHECKSOX_994 [Bathymodiolus heckerae thiotrophic gill symbiont]